MLTPLWYHLPVQMGRAELAVAGASVGSSEYGHLITPRTSGVFSSIPAARASSDLGTSLYDVHNHSSLSRNSVLLHSSRGSRDSDSWLVGLGSYLVGHQGPLSPTDAAAAQSPGTAAGDGSTGAVAAAAAAADRFEQQKQQQEQLGRQLRHNSSPGVLAASSLGLIASSMARTASAQTGEQRQVGTQGLSASWGGTGAGGGAAQRGWDQSQGVAGAEGGRAPWSATAASSPNGVAFQRQLSQGVRSSKSDTSYGSPYAGMSPREGDGYHRSGLGPFHRSHAGGGVFSSAVDGALVGHDGGYYGGSHLSRYARSVSPSGFNHRPHPPQLPRHQGGVTGRQGLGRGSRMNVAISPRGVVLREMQAPMPEAPMMRQEGWEGSGAQPELSFSGQTGAGADSSETQSEPLPSIPVMQPDEQQQAGAGPGPRGEGVEDSADLEQVWQQQQEQGHVPLVHQHYHEGVLEAAAGGGSDTDGTGLSGMRQRRGVAPISVMTAPAPDMPTSSRKPEAHGWSSAVAANKSSAIPISNGGGSISSLEPSAPQSVVGVSAPAPSPVPGYGVPASASGGNYLPSSGGIGQYGGRGLHPGHHYPPPAASAQMVRSHHGKAPHLSTIWSSDGALMNSSSGAAATPPPSVRGEGQPGELHRQIHPGVASAPSTRHLGVNGLGPAAYINPSGDSTVTTGDGGHAEAEEAVVGGAGGEAVAGGVGGAESGSGGEEKNSHPFVRSTLMRVPSKWLRPRDAKRASGGLSRWNLVKWAFERGLVVRLLEEPTYSVLTSTFKRLYPQDFDRIVAVVNHEKVDKLLIKWEMLVAKLARMERAPPMQCKCCHAEDEDREALWVSTGGVMVVGALQVR